MGARVSRYVLMRGSVSSSTYPAGSKPKAVQVPPVEGLGRGEVEIVDLAGLQGLKEFRLEVGYDRPIPHGAQMIDEVEMLLVPVGSVCGNQALAEGREVVDLSAARHGE